MTQTNKIQGKMKEKGLTISTLSLKIGISKTSLFNKIHNQREFLASEISSIRTVLNLSDSEVQEIFFAKSVELKSTKEN